MCEVLVLLHGLLLFAPWGAWCDTEPPKRLLWLPPLLAGRAELAEVCFMAGVWLIPSPVAVVNVKFLFRDPWDCRIPPNSGVWYLHTWKGMPWLFSPRATSAAAALGQLWKDLLESFFFSGLLLLLLVYQREKLWRDLSLCLLCPWRVCVCVCRHCSSAPATPAALGQGGRWELPDEVGNSVNWSRDGCWKVGGRLLRCKWKGWRTQNCWVSLLVLFVSCLKIYSGILILVIRITTQRNMAECGQSCPGRSKGNLRGMKAVFVVR